LIGGNDQNKNNIFIIDFGLAKCYKNSDGEHIPFREGKNLTGTARYASINTHIGYEQSRRDDLETIGHVLLYFLRGSLPWQGLPGRSKNEKYNNIKKKKLEVTVDELCKGHPEEFREFMNFCRKLQFTEDPDYKYVLGLFEGCMKKNGWDPKVPDFIWNKNRLVLEKEALKQNLMKVISKPIKKQDNEEAGEQTKGGPEGKKIDKNSNTVRFMILILDINYI
jgi:casein kinase 1